MSDEIIWDVIGHNFCAFKIRTDKNQNFCRNQYNVTGLCNRQSCPLANQQYATIRSVDGKLYLYMRTAERSHMPSKWWERIKLSKQYSRALQQIDERLIYWPNFLIHKCKQRLTRLTQVAILARRQALKDEERHYVGVKPKVKRREETRERKALKAAKLEKSIEKELLERLKSGAYGENPLNVDEKLWKRVMNKTEKLNRRQQEENEDEEYEDELESELEEEDSDVGQVEYVEDDDAEDDYKDMQDIENAIMLGESDYSTTSDEDEDDNESDQESQDSEPAPPNGSAKRSRADEANGRRKRPGPRKVPRVEVEYEQEEPAQSELVSTSAQDW